MGKDTRKVKNSSGKEIGTVTISTNQIVINHYLKPELIISDPDDVNLILKLNNEGIILLYDKYYLNIGEIASIYGVCYSNLNKRIKKLTITTGKNDNRRSSTYGQKLSEETKRKIGEKSIGRHIPAYERTSEIREKISKGLKEYYATRKRSMELPLQVRRCDHFQIRISGFGDIKIYSIAKVIEEGSVR